MFPNKCVLGNRKLPSKDMLSSYVLNSFVPNYI
jgi:hypothetical protein